MSYDVSGPRVQPHVSGADRRQGVLLGPGLAQLCTGIQERTAVHAPSSHDGCFFTKLSRHESRRGLALMAMPQST